jgi:hypothetical protein
LYHRRKAKHWPGIAGAKRTDDEVMQLGGVLDHNHVFALQAAISEFRNGGVGVRQQASLVPRITPRPRDDTRAITGANFVLVGVDHRIERRRINHPLFDEQ